MAYCPSKKELKSSNQKRSILEAAIRPELTFHLNIYPRLPLIASLDYLQSSISGSVTAGSSTAAAASADLVPPDADSVPSAAPSFVPPKPSASIPITELFAPSRVKSVELKNTNDYIEESTVVKSGLNGNLCICHSGLSVVEDLTFAQQICTRCKVYTIQLFNIIKVG